MSSQRERSESAVWIVGETDRIEEHYTLGAALGQPGQFGRAVLAEAKDAAAAAGGPRAVKIISKARFTRGRAQLKQLFDSFRQEIAVMKQMDHPNVIRFHEAFEDRTQFYIVMELCSGGELFDRITAMGQYNEKDAAAVLRQILGGVNHMHSKKIAHCDLKPDNLIFDAKGPEGQLKLIDFGMSKHVAPRQYLKKFCGTPYYVAPEVIDGRYDEACDMWSVGVVLFVMLHGYPPFYADPNRFGDMADERVYHLIKKGFDPTVKAGYGPHFPKAIPTSEAARDLISRLLVHDTRKRLTAAEALEHPWVTGASASDQPIARSVIEALRSFQGRAKLKQHVVNMMASELSADQIQHLRTTFRGMDTNGDGVITFDELEKALQSVDGSGGAEAAAALLKNADTDGDGRLSYEEVLHAYVQRQLNLREERLWDAFTRLDANGDGRLDATELLTILGEEDPAKVREIIAEVDKDGDGHVDYSEFLALWSAASD